MKRAILAVALAVAVSAQAAPQTRPDFCIAQGRAAVQVYVLLRNGTAPADLPASLILPAEVAYYVVNMAKPPFGNEAAERASVQAFAAGYCMGATLPRAPGTGV